MSKTKLELEQEIAKLTEQLNRYTAKYNALFEQVPVGVIVLCIDGQVMEANHEVLKYLGSPSVEASKKFNIYLIDYLKKTNFIQNFEACIHQKTIKEDQNLYTSQWGESRTMRYRLSPILNTENQVFQVQATFVDITAEIHNRNKLEESQNRYKVLSDMAFEGILIHKNGLALDVNKALCKLSGYQRNELLGKNLIELLVHPESMALVAENIKKEHATPYSIRILKKDGSFFWAKIEGRNFTPANGKTIRAVSVRDVTEQLRAQEQLQKLTTAIEQSSNAMVITDTNATIEYINPAFTSLTGYSKKEAIGQKMSILKSGLQPDDFYKDVWKTIKLGKTWQSLFHNRNKFGELYWEQNTITPIKNNNGQITNYISIKENITELIENQLRLDTLINAIPDPIIFKNAKGQWLEINNACMQLFTLSDVDFQGKTSLDLAQFIPKFKPIFEEDHLADIQAWQTKTLVKTKHVFPSSGSENKRTFDVTRVPLFQENGDKKAIIVIARDITEREKGIVELEKQNQQYIVLSEQYKQQNKQLKQAKNKAEESDKLKTSFINNISHEFRTPMNSIIGFSNLLMRNELSKEKKQQYCNTIERNCNILLDIVSDTIEISKIQSNQLLVRLKKTPIKQTISEVITQFEPLAREKKLELIHEISCSREATILIDSYKLQQILRHLISNALKFTHEGFIKVTCSLAPNSMLRISIKDTGIGISADKQKIIFAPYAQAEIGSSRTFGGIGIGLTLVKAYIDLLNGQLDIQSDINQGSEFIILLPYEVIPQTVAKPSQSVILLAEDDFENFTFLHDFMAENDIKVIHARTGKEAIDLCRQQYDFKLIIMDLHMPIMDGISATKLIKEFKPEIPVIALTAHYTEHNNKELHTFGFEKILAKPISFSELNQIIDMYL